MKWFEVAGFAFTQNCKKKKKNEEKRSEMGFVGDIGYSFGERMLDVGSFVACGSTALGGIVCSHGHVSQFYLCLLLANCVNLSLSRCPFGDRFTQTGKRFVDNLPTRHDSEQIYL